MNTNDKIRVRSDLIAHISDDGFNRRESVAEHTQKTAFLCNAKGKRCGLSKVMSLCGILHDLGKNKKSFSDYICADDSIKRKLRGSVSHASTGAKYMNDMYGDRVGHAKIMIEMVSYAVAAHHGMFDIIDKDNHDIFCRKLGQIDGYDEACDNAKREYLSNYNLDHMVIEATDEFRVVLDKVNHVFEMMRSKASWKDTREKAVESKFFLLACLQRLILSMLIDSDWEATSDFMDNIDTLSKKTETDAKKIFGTAADNFKAYMQKKQQAVCGFQMTDKEKAIFDARNALQNECVEFAKYSAGIYCMQIPTGGGKTLSSLAYALEFCRLHPETERVIYISPYISVTEQNAKVFREAIGFSQWILEHHSSVVRNEDTESEDFRFNPLSKYEMNWEEPFICTTFVQFMNTIFSDKSESVRRMHRLINSVVIIDEVQSMPLKCIHTFNYMINFLNSVCNTNIILCTATQPTLDETGCPICYSEPKHMIAKVSDWFRIFDRVKIDVPQADKKQTFESLRDEIVERMRKYRSILVVLNTKSAVKRLYDELKEWKVNVEYLTTNLCAAHREVKIEKIKRELKEPQEPLVVVSTNLIEAGVDISFECVYRSIAGLDSLAQSAGRCNRNGEMEWGRVCLIALEGENSGSMGELLQKVRVTESLFYEYYNSGSEDSLLMSRWMDEYYKRIYYYTLDQMNFPIREFDTSIIELLSRGFGSGEKKNSMRQAYKTAGQEYRVIEDHSFGVIVPYGEGKKIIESIQNTTDFGTIKAYIREAQRYTVNVREGRLKEFEGLIQPVSDKIQGLYMIALPGGYNEDYGISPEWETLIY